jgi:DNA-binding IclR family transcriptional regulator
LFAGVTLQPVTEKTPLTVPDLIRQIEQDREIGMAWSDSFFEPGISSVAAPVFDQTGNVFAAINVTSPTAAFCATPQKRKEIGAAVVSAAEDISRRLGWTQRGLSLPLV